MLGIFCFVEAMPFCQGILMDGVVFLDIGSWSAGIVGSESLIPM